MLEFPPFFSAEIATTEWFGGRGLDFFFFSPSEPACGCDCGLRGKFVLHPCGFGVEGTRNFLSSRPVSAPSLSHPLSAPCLGRLCWAGSRRPGKMTQRNSVCPRLLQFHSELPRGWHCISALRSNSWSRSQPAGPARLREIFPPGTWRPELGIFTQP